MSDELNKLRYFDSGEAAKAYAEARPYFHPIVMERVRVVASLGEPLENGMDVGCGTGLSTRALRLLATNVLGTDISQAMLDNAQPIPGVRYLVASAEDQPVEDQTQDIATISSAFHWVDPDRFVAEMRRILRPSGLLIVYENGFTGEMIDEPKFSLWLHEQKLSRFPTPPRRRKFSLEAPSGFHVLANESYQNQVEFNSSQLVQYFITQTNVIAKVEAGETTYGEAKEWLDAQVQPFFSSGQTGRFQFAGNIHVLKRE